MKAALFFEDDQLCHLGENMGKKAIKVSTITTEDDKIISIKNSEVKNFIDKVFDGKKSTLMVSLTKDSKLTEEETKTLMSLIEKIDG